MGVPYRSPANLLASLFLKSIHSPLIILTGPRGSGKTSFCQKLVEQARACGFQPEGLISPAIFVGKEKVGIELLDVASGERCLLSSPRGAHAAPISTQTWDLDPRTLAWGDRLLSIIHDCPLLIIDELGPLEFTRNAGWQSGLRLVDERNYGLAVVVVRPSLLPAALGRWPWAQVLTLPVSEEATP